MKVNYLKIKPEYFKDIECGVKTFELRKNDRDFEVGDVLMLIKLDDEGNETDQVMRVKVTYVLKDCPDYGLKEGYAILGIDADSIMKYVFNDYGCASTPINAHEEGAEAEGELI